MTRRSFAFALVLSLAAGSAVVVPASAGPAIVATLKTIRPRLTAFGKTSGGTSAGINDCRAGVSKAVAAEANALNT